MAGTAESVGGPLRIVRLEINRFRSIRSAILYPGVNNVFLGPNNIGKTTILEALNLLLNPEIGSRGSVVDENDFYCRDYRSVPPVAGPAATAGNCPATDLEQTDRDADEALPDGDMADTSVVAAHEDATIEPGASGGPTVETGSVVSDAEDVATEPPVIRVEAVIAGLTDDDINEFASVLVPWDANQRAVIEGTEEGNDPFANAEIAVRPCFEAWYDEDEDEFAWRSFFRTDPQLSRDASPAFTKRHKRSIGFLIYRDFRALQRPITLEPYTLFGRLLQSQAATPKNFEKVLDELQGSILPLFGEPNFARVVNEYRQELLRYLPLANIGEGRLSFEATARTREQVKAAAQLYVEDEIPLPLQKMGAGTRSLAILAILLLIARKRGRGIIALEEPETFLFPHAQRRVIDEVLALASQTFVTTHSPYVLERLPVDSFQRLLRSETATVSTTPLVTDPQTAREIRDRFRKQLSEALLGRGAIVVEEESTRLWVLKTSALLHGREFEGTRVEALELQGISVVTAQGNGDVPSVGALLRRAGLQVVGFLDQVTDKELKQYVDRDPELPLVFHPDKGLEDLLLRELPHSLVREVLIAAPYTKHKYEPANVDGWTVEEFNTKARDYLKRYKGYIPLHEWLLDQVDFEAMPETFKRLVVLVATASDKREPCNTCSLVPKGR
jgi:putative ATP-dependent endonuclease of the OLD family